MRTIRHLTVLIPVLVPAALVPATLAQDVYLSRTLAELDLRGEPNLERRLGALDARNGQAPRLVVESGAAEAYLGVPWRAPWGEDPLTVSEVQLGVRADGGSREVRGTIWLSDGRDRVAHAFVLPLDDARSDARADFLEAKALHYTWLYSSDLPGAAWFRHRAREASDEYAILTGERIEFDPEQRMRGRRGRKNDLEQTYALFTGGQALAENLALDQAVEPAGSEGPLIPVDEIEGITVQELEFPQPAEIAIDALVARIPIDQHGVFFPSFSSFVRVVDELKASGAPALELFDASSQDARTQERYERQLCLSLDAAARMFGDSLIESVAVTGGDPYLRTGSDVTLLLRAREVGLLESFVAERQEAAAARDGAREVRTRVGGVEVVGVVTDDRTISSYRMRLDRDLLVSNSLAALERLVEVAAGERESLLAAPEYPFFRGRYPVDEPEDAFLVLTDATIRRWCGPRWRIGASRRVRAAALMADARARDLEARLVRGENPAPGVIASAMPLPGAGALRRTDQGILSDTYGTPEFVTPIVELDMDLVTTAERDGYVRFRDDYERRWREAFDPIAARLVCLDDGIELDVSVMPLVVRSEYRELIQLSRGATLPADAGDPHADALYHFGLALGRESWIFSQSDGFARMVAPGLADPLAWVGQDVSIWVDRDDEYFARLSESGDGYDFLEEHGFQLPIGIRIASTDSLRLAGFITGLRGMIDSSAPGLVRFEAREHAERGYVAILPEGLEDLAGGRLEIYYATFSDAFVLSLREEVIQRAIERDLARRKGEAVAGSDERWLGESAGLRLRGEFLGLVEAFVGDEWARERRDLSWLALPILDEWRQLGVDDPLAFHAGEWGVALRCPGDGEYAWDPAVGAHASTAFGRPAAPLDGPRLPAAVKAVRAADLGLTFEDGGLRARVRLLRHPR